MRLAGKTAFVTAAGQGIGRAIAEAFAREGATVTATDRDPALLAGLEMEVAALDVTERATLQAMIRSQAPDILVNAAGIVHAGAIEDVTDADFTTAFDVNLRPMIHAVQAVLPTMQAKGSGSIINIASVASSTMGVPNRVLYSASKAAVIGMTKAVAADVITSGIRINAICPGTVNSPSLHERLRATGDYEAALAAFQARQKMGRIAEPQEIADLAVYLGSDESRYVTGQDMIIDGGMSL